MLGCRRHRAQGALLRVQVTRAAELAHLPLDRTGPALHVGTRIAGVVAPRAGQHRGQARALRRRQCVGIAPEESPRGGLDAIHTVAELGDVGVDLEDPLLGPEDLDRSEEHTSELQSLMRISYAVFCLKKKKITQKN